MLFFLSAQGQAFGKGLSSEQVRETHTGHRLPTPVSHADKHRIGGRREKGSLLQSPTIADMDLRRRGSHLQEEGPLLRGEHPYTQIPGHLPTFCRAQIVSSAHMTIKTT